MKLIEVFNAKGASSEALDFFSDFIKCFDKLTISVVDPMWRPAVVSLLKQHANMLKGLKKIGKQIVLYQYQSHPPMLTVLMIRNHNLLVKSTPYHIIMKSMAIVEIVLVVVLQMLQMATMIMIGMMMMMVVVMGIMRMIQLLIKEVRDKGLRSTILVHSMLVMDIKMLHVQLLLSVVNLPAVEVVETLQMVTVNKFLQKRLKIYNFPIFDSLILILSLRISPGN